MDRSILWQGPPASKCCGRLLRYTTAFACPCSASARSPSADESSCRLAAAPSATRMAGGASSSTLKASLPTMASPQPLNVRHERALRPIARQRKPDVVSTRMRRVWPPGENFGGNFLARRRFIANGLDDGVSTSVANPSRHEHRHQRHRHLHAGSQPFRQLVGGEFVGTRTKDTLRPGAMHFETLAA